MTLAPSAWKAYDQSQIPELCAGFEGSGEVASAELLIGIVDKFARPLFRRPRSPIWRPKDDSKVKLDWTEVELDTFGQSITDPTYNVCRAQDAPLPAAADTAYAQGSQARPDRPRHHRAHELSAQHLLRGRCDATKVYGRGHNRVDVFVFGVVPGSSQVCVQVPSACSR